MPEKTFTLSLNNLYCYFVEENEYDDVFLKFKGKKIWPRKKRMMHIPMDSTVGLNVEIKGVREGQAIVIELWDHDWFSPNDLLGTFSFEIEGVSGPFTTDMKRNKEETDKAKYTLEWEVF